MASASSNKAKVKSGNKSVGNQGANNDENNGVSNSTASRRENSASTRDNAIHLSFTFVFWSLVSTFSIAFGSGYAARRLLIQQLAAGHPQLLQIPILPTIPKHPEINAAAAAALPPPKVRDDKEVPSTHYSSKITNTTASASAHTILLEKRTSSHTKPIASPVTDKSNGTTGKWQECAVDENYEAQGETCQVSKETSAKYDGKHTEDDTQEEEEEEEAPHLPAGQHLLVDIKNVNRDFLNSEPRLAQAMVDVVWESDLTLLSYHCHSLLPMGVSCVGVLLESHISFHTWPEAGVITLDLFTCGSGLLLPILPIIERLFAIPDEPIKGDQSSEPTTMIWVHKLRGFRPQDDATSKFLGQSDLATDLLGVMDLDMKKQVRFLITDVFTPTFFYVLLKFTDSTLGFLFL
jgi:S-adenosylmethionine decarboxylase proenzyme